jgi:hypothetical protein
MCSCSNRHTCVFAVLSAKATVPPAWISKVMQAKVSCHVVQVVEEALNVIDVCRSL